MPHFPGKIAAIPHLRVGDNTLDDTWFTRCTPFFAIVNTDLNTLTLKSSWNPSWHHTQIGSGDLPIGIVFEEFRIVVARPDKLSQTTLGILGDLVECLLILPLLEGFDKRINGGVACIGGCHQVNDGDPAQPQIGFDIGRFDAVASQTIRFPEDHTEWFLTSKFLAL